MSKYASTGGLMIRNHSWLAICQRIVDVVSVYVILLFLCLFNDVVFDEYYTILAILASAFAWVSMGAMGVYRPWRSASLWQQLKLIILGWLIVIFVLFFIGWVTKTGNVFSRLVVGEWLLIVPIFLMILHILQRIFLRLLRTKGYNSRRAVIVGAGDVGQDLAKRILKSDWMGVKLVGFFDDDLEKKSASILDAPVIGSIKDVYPFVRDNGIEQVYFALPMRSENAMKEVFNALQDTTASLFLLPDMFIFELFNARAIDVAGMHAFALRETPFQGPFGVLKRLEDIVLASVILSLIWPLMLVIAVAVKLSSRGSVLFVQKRYGLHGDCINVYKFRTMKVSDNDAIVIKQATLGDDRITRLGAFLRKTSLDELPQFINVLQGRMSVVGPRPHAVAHNEQYRRLIKGYMWRHKVKPGITGWAQVNGWRGETDTLEKMQKRIEYDLDYIQNWTIWLDIKIVYLTLFKGFIGSNAY